MPGLHGANGLPGHGISGGASDKPDPGQKGGHASAGAVLLHRLGGEQNDLYRGFAMQAMCEAIFSHHAALPDNISPQGEDGYKARLQCDEAEYQEIQEYFLQEIISRNWTGFYVWPMGM